MTLEDVCKELQTEICLTGILFGLYPRMYTWHAKLIDVTLEENGFEPLKVIQGSGNSIDEALHDLILNLQGKLVYKKKRQGEGVMSIMIKELHIPVTLTP